MDMLPMLLFCLVCAVMIFIGLRDTKEPSRANPPYTSDTWSAAKPGERPCPNCGGRIQRCPEGEYCSWTECDYVS